MISELFKDNKVKVLLVVLAVSLFLLFMRDLNPTTLDAHFGIEFKGGVRIPIFLDRAVTTDEMSAVTEVIKSRVNKFGLAQVIVKSIGNNQVVVELPQANQNDIKFIEKLLNEQGRFEVLIEGQQALNGQDILQNAVGGPNGEQVSSSDPNTASWQLTFGVSRDAADKFSKVALGKANLPVYMFLDRPEKALLVVPDDYLSGAILSQDIIDRSLKKEGDNINLVTESQFKITNVLNYSTIVLSFDFFNFSSVSQTLKNNGFAINGSKKYVLKEKSTFYPQATQASTGVANGISRWDAIGLVSAPQLSPGLASGLVSQFYLLTGSVPSVGSLSAEDNARNEIKFLKSVISGGKLPVGASIGSSYSITSQLGDKFLQASMVGLFLAVLAVALIIVLRYRRLKLIIPILLTNVFEIVILAAVLGTFGTIDFSAMAGIIALIGTGVDSQIIITEELIGKKQVNVEEESDKQKLKKAFFIIFSVVAVGSASMLPLVFSGVIEVRGFAISTILGLIIGVFVTRPAYGSLIKLTFHQEELKP